jgi:hypothetical protein
VPPDFVMKSTSTSRLIRLSIVVALAVWLVFFVGKHGIRSLHRAPAWAAAGAKIKLGLEQDASSGMGYDRTLRGPLPLATVVKDFHDEWPSGSVSMIHFAALEVGTALLHRGDIEVGEMVGGKFVPVSSPAWEINRRMIDELRHSPILFGNMEVYVFRRK